MKMKAKKSESKFSLVKKSALALILVIFALALISGVTSAATTHVVNTTAACTSGNFYYTSIQAAVWNASGGDTIIVCPEATAYQEAIDVNKSHIVIKAHNETKPVVSALNNPNDHVFDITDQTNVTLEGFEIRDANGTTENVAGIYMKNASECNISGNVVTNISATHDARGICLYYSSNNNSFHTSTVYNLSAGNAFGISLHSSSNNSFYSSTTVSYINASDYAFGILLESSSNNNSFHTSTVYNLSANEDVAYGIFLSSSSNNSFHTSTVYNLSANEDDAYGIYLYSSSNNSFSSGSISDITAPDWWNFHSNERSHRNSAENITISSYPTTISFTYDNGVGIKSVETPPPDPALKSNIGKYVNATNVTADSWLFLNVSYNESDVSGVQEDSLKLWRHNGTTWHEVAGVNGVNTAENYVYANITDFSVFAPLGNSTRVTIPTATGTGNVTIETDKGYFCNETDALPESPPDPPALTFPHGFFNVTICGLNTATAENVTINFTFPTAIPRNAEFWKYNSSNGTWYPYPFDSNDGVNVISITITDNNATGDHNPVLGVINDPNGVGWRIAAAKVPALTPIGLIALVGLLSVIAAMSISMRRKK